MLKLIIAIKKEREQNKGNRSGQVVHSWREILPQNEPDLES